MIYQLRDAFTLRGSLYVPASTPAAYDKSEHTFEITLRYAGKEYVITDSFAAWDEERDAQVVCTYMYEEGNYNCDCNRSNFLYQQHDVDFSVDPRREWEAGYEGGAWVLRCGGTIELVGIREVSA